MQSFLQKIILFLFLLAGYCANAQLKFTATITPAEIGKDEYAQLKLMVENANEVQQIVPPNLSNFIIVSGPNQESGMTMNNNSVKKYIALSFVIKPKTTGSFTIPPSLAKADGIDLKSNSVKLKVTATSTGNNPGVNAYNYGQLNIDSTSIYKTFSKAYRYSWFRLTMNNKTYYLKPYDYTGESLLLNGRYTYKLTYSTITDRLNLELFKD